MNQLLCSGLLLTKHITPKICNKKIKNLLKTNNPLQNINHMPKRKDFASFNTCVNVWNLILKVFSSLSDSMEVELHGGLSKGKV